MRFPKNQQTQQLSMRRLLSDNSFLFLVIAFSSFSVLFSYTGNRWLGLCKTSQKRQQGNYFWLYVPNQLIYGWWLSMSGSSWGSAFHSFNWNFYRKLWFGYNELDQRQLSLAQIVTSAFHQTASSTFHRIAGSSLSSHCRELLVCRCHTAKSRSLKRKQKFASA